MPRRHHAGQPRQLTFQWFELASVCARQDEHPLDVPRHGHEVPLAAHIVDATQQELAEPEHRFDDAEHRLGRLLAQGVEFLALGRLEAMIHRLKRRGVLAATAVAPRNVRRAWDDALHGPSRSPDRCPPRHRHSHCSR